MKPSNTSLKQKIGLTGGIGAGKTTVSNRLRMLGAKVIDADEISRNALMTYGPCYSAVIELFGTEILKQDASIDRTAIATRIFSDESMRIALNNIVHPYVLETMHAECNTILKKEPNAIVVFDIPLLIECGAYRDMDYNIVIIADDLARIHRICKRNGVSAEEARARIQSQIPQDVQCTYADYVIDNSGSLDMLYRQTDAIYAKIRGDIL